MRIQDGKGKGYEAEVDSTNRLVVAAVSQSVEHNANRSGAAWSMILEQTATGANDFIFYLENTGTKTYVLEGLVYRVASAEQIKIYLDRTGTPSGGTTLTPATLNTGSSKTVTGTVESGNDITGTSGGRVVEHIFMTSTESKSYNFDQDIFVEPGGTFMVEAISGSVQVNLAINIHELEAE